MTDRKPKRPSGRETLLSACDRLFLHAGYSRVSVADILGESGLKAPSLYHHFGDKEGLYLAWVRSALARAGCLLEAAVTGSDRESVLSDVARIVVSPEFPDVLEMLRDRASLSESGKAEVRNEVGHHVYRWFDQALGAAGEPSSERRTAMATLLANALVASRSRYAGDQASGECPLGLLSEAMLRKAPGARPESGPGLSRSADGHTE